jgi:hypothetical protein
MQKAPLKYSKASMYSAPCGGKCQQPSMSMLDVAGSAGSMYSGVAPEYTRQNIPPHSCQLQSAPRSC